MLETFSKTRKDRIEEMQDAKDKQGHRDKFRKKRASKKIGKSEKVHQKNKPLMMTKHKKIKAMQERMGGNKPTQGPKLKRFLGHFRKSTCQRLEAKKAGRK